MSKASSNKKNINVMVVDDSAVIRGLFTGILNSDSGIQVVASANNGQIAINTLKRMKGEIDVITLDIQMPERGGLESISELLAICPDVKIIMASSLSTDGAKETLDALSLGAADYLAKPNNRQAGEMQAFTTELVAKIKALSGSGIDLNNISSNIIPSSLNKNGIKTNTKKVKEDSNFELHKVLCPLKPQALVIGSSTGGPQALNYFFSQLRGKTLHAPIFITQHMPAEFTELLAQQLSNASGQNVKEAVDGEKVVNNRIYLAPGGYHMLITGDKKAPIIKITKDPAENFCRPAVDPMLRSIVDVYGGSLLVMILTGMGADGRKASKIASEAGAVIIAQDEETSVVWGMPGAVAMDNICSHVLPLDQLTTKFIELSQGQVR